ncbi:MAG: hypothetical protein NPIRA03_22140 [Nitrospirales bacterium]|nr:MAG: hypothetical protein NPIRA03_22140 [Nitrospirales bacterium]
MRDFRALQLKIFADNPIPMSVSVMTIFPCYHFDEQSQDNLNLFFFMFPSFLHFSHKTAEEEDRLSGYGYCWIASLNKEIPLYGG